MPATAPAPPQDYPFGFVLWNTNQRIDSAELTNIGEMALRAMTALVSRLLADEPSTFPSGFFGDDCKVTINVGLTMDVAGGLGFFNVNEYDANDHDHVVYRPIAFNGDQVTLGAHHATLPRIDIISLAPAYEDIAEESRQIWDPGTESFGPDDVFTRRVVSYTLTTTAGTPAGSPAVPATPSGHIKLAELAVPATSGAVVVTDSRPLLRVAPSLLRGPATPVCALVAIGNEVVDTGADVRNITIRTVTWDWYETVAGVQRYQVELLDDFMVPFSGGGLLVTTGTAISINPAPNTILLDTDSGGVAGVRVIPITGTPFAGTVFLRITPVGFGFAGPPRPGFAQVVELTFA